MDIEMVSSDIYFRRSLASLSLSNYKSATESIDLAIENTSNKNYYMFQKIKILFVAKNFDQCANYILKNFKALYFHSSLHVFSKILYYYQVSSGSFDSSLEVLLIKNDIPAILAQEYTSFIDNQDINLLEKIVYYKEAEDCLTCIDYCNLLLKEDRFNMTVHLIKARCYCLLGEKDLGIEAYEAAINLDSSAHSIYNELGTAMISYKQYPKAISCFQKALDLDSSNIEYRSQLAEGYYLWKKYDSALINFKKVLKKKPQCIETLLRTANTYEQIHKPKKAKKYYKRVLGN